MTDYSRLRSATARHLLRALLADGFTLRRQKGSHRHFFHPDGRRVHYPSTVLQKPFGLAPCEALLRCRRVGARRIFTAWGCSDELPTTGRPRRRFDKRGECEDNDSYTVSLSPNSFSFSPHNRGLQWRRNIFL
ncbi:MAG: type II toxin-antitoxin system HicA family toxin [Candidatus Acidiferrales bacterium]